VKHFSARKEYIASLPASAGTKEFWRCDAGQWRTQKQMSRSLPIDWRGDTITKPYNYSVPVPYLSPLPGIKLGYR
jgi:hypothetical protein